LGSVLKITEVCSAKILAIFSTGPVM
jgi:hypothetical protein